MIHLEKTDKQWIKICKCKLHYESKYPFKGTWIETLKPLFKDIYGWDPDSDYHTYLNVLFNKLLDVHLKIVDDRSGSNLQLREIFSAAFYKSISRTNDLPIERSISQLCGLIQCNTVIQEDGTRRYEL